MAEEPRIEFEKEFDRYISKMIEGDLRYVEEAKKKLRDLGKLCNIPFEGKIHELFVNATSQLNSIRKSLRWSDAFANNYERIIENAKRLLPKEFAFKVPDKTKIKEIYKQRNYVKV